MLLRQLVAQPSVVSCYDRGEISGFLMNGEIVVEQATVKLCFIP